MGHGRQHGVVCPRWRNRCANWDRRTAAAPEPVQYGDKQDVQYSAGFNWDIRSKEHGQVIPLSQHLLMSEPGALVYWSMAVLRIDCFQPLLKTFDGGYLQTDPHIIPILSVIVIISPLVATISNSYL
jgi:hypothetical protein